MRNYKPTGPRAKLVTPFGSTIFETGGLSFEIACATGERVGTATDWSRNGIYIWCRSLKKLVVVGILPQRPVWVGGDKSVAKRMELMATIQAMSADELDAFIESQDGALYNPFWWRRQAVLAQKVDQNLRKGFPVASFTESPDMTSRLKRAIVHEFERFVVARVASGSAFARNLFTTRMHLLLGLCGCELTDNRIKDYGEFCHLNGKFKALLKRIASEKACDSPDKKDLYRALAVIAGSYKTIVPIFKDSESNP